MNSWIDRYRHDQQAQVWNEMTSLGADIRSEPEDLAAAVAVAQETMRRARSNVERLIEGLTSYGFQFDSPPLTDPGPDVVSELDGLEAEIGVLPLSLRAWFEQVGQVNLNGSHPDWTNESPYPDPLVVEAPVDYVRSEYEAWSDDRGTEWERGSTFVVPIAPDYLHKANISGGMPYGLAVPNPAADGLVLWELHQTTFVNYLRIAFAAGGMPGWQAQPGSVNASESPDSPAPVWILELGRELLPI